MARVFDGVLPAANVGGAAVALRSAGGGDCDTAAKAAYAARNGVVLLDVHGGAGGWRTLVGHTHRVTCVCWVAGQGLAHLLLIGAQDKAVRAWDTR